MKGRATVETALLLGGLLMASAPGWPEGGAPPDEPKRPPPWGDRWEPPRPPQMPEPPAPLDAAAFAADCNEDGRVRVDGDLVVRGGSGTLTVDCSIEVAPAAVLTFSDVTLSGPYALDVRCGPAGGVKMEHSYVTMVGRIAVGGAGGATLSVSDSELSSMAQGAIDISLTGAEASVELVDSMIMSDGAMRIDVSPRADSGRVVVRGATLAAGTSAAFDLSLAASLAGVGGEAVVQQSELIGAALIAIETGARGRTEVRDNVIDTPGEVRIAAGEGGHCESSGNDPALSCPPPGGQAASEASPLRKP